MIGPRLTHHACERFQERVSNISREQIEATLSTPAMAAAIAWAGCCTVRLATGQRILVQDGHVITVLPTKPKRQQFKGARRL